MADTTITTTSTTNSERNVPLPPVGDYTLTISPNGQTHWVKVTEEDGVRDLFIRVLKNEDWERRQSIKGTWDMGYGDWTLTDRSASVTLTPGAFYNHYGRVMLATSDKVMVAVSDESMEPVAPTTETALIADVGTGDWLNRLTGVHRRVMTEAANIRRSYSRLTKHLEDLGQALLQEAEDRDWCSEYDEFAEKWDLPQRRRNYEVTMTVTVSATSVDEASEFVEGALSINMYTDEVEYGPSFSVEEA